MKPDAFAIARDNCDMLRLALWMTGALLSFSAAALSVRELAKSISVFGIMSFRSGTGLLFLAALAVARPEPRRSLAPLDGTARFTQQRSLCMSDLLGVGLIAGVIVTI